jgi:hypothetical protein
MWIEVQQLVVLITNKVVRRSRFATEDADTLWILQCLADGMKVDVIQRVKTKSQRNQNQQRLPSSTCTFDRLTDDT